MAKIMILGAGGRLGAALARAYAAEHEVVACGRREADLGTPDAVANLVTELRPGIVINSAAMTNVDVCESDRVTAETVNAAAPAAIAKAAGDIGARLIHISTDYVFSGETDRPCAEEDDAQPISWYGATKRAGEKAVLEAGERHGVVRVSWVFGPDRDSFIDKALATALRGDPVRAVADKYSSPTFTPDVADGLRALLPEDAPGGIYHLCNRGVCTWQSWAQQAIDCAVTLGLPIAPGTTVEPLKLADIKAMVAKRPVYTAMSCAKIERLLGRPMRPWQDAVADYVRLLRDEGRLR